MNKKTHEEKRHREAVLDGLRSVELGVMLRGMGWEIGGRQNKANRRAAILHLEGYAVAREIVRSLGLRRVEGGEGIGESGAAAIVGDGDVAEGINTDEGNTDGDGGIVSSIAIYDDRSPEVITLGNRVFSEEEIAALRADWDKLYWGNGDQAEVRIIRFDDGGQPIDRDEALAVVKRVAERGMN